MAEAKQEAFMVLPKKFETRMQELLKDEFEDYMKTYEEKPLKGLRVNTLKISTEEFEKIAPFELKPIPWTSNGYYFDAEKVQPAKHPYYLAGLYYIQEPCAMTPARILPVEPGDRVLDLCAAPGGKSTELAAKLKGEGILVSNDISHSRARALLKNLELFGVKNAIVLSESPERLSEKLEEYFDKILIDAPCSGEGMFRKDPAIMKTWEAQGVEPYSKLQKQILDSAVKMLKPGGKMVFSTCTFSPEENEQSIQYVLEHYPEFSVVKVEGCEYFSKGRPDWIENGDASLENCIRLWPHKVRGEGHFVTLLEKSGDGIRANGTEYPRKTVKVSEEAEQFLAQAAWKVKAENCELHHEKLFLLPKEMPDISRFRSLRAGVYLGETKKKRFEPSHTFAMALKAEEYDNVLNFTMREQEEEIRKYLKGETLDLEDDKKKGWVLVCVDGYPLGWGKADRGRLKNKYNANWRLF